MYKPNEFIPQDLTIERWEDIQPYFQTMIDLEIKTTDGLKTVIQKFSDTLAVFYEKYAWSYINMSCHTDKQNFVDAYENFSTKISPEVQKASNIIEKKISNSPLFDEIDAERYGQFRKNLLREIELFRRENVDLDAHLSTLSSKYEQITGGLTATIDGEDLPLPRAAVKLQNENREIRKQAWLAIWETRYNIRESLDEIYNEMIQVRHKIAMNAGYKNYRNFQHDNLHRFDYTPKDAENFHDAIEKYVVPLSREIGVRHRKKLGLPSDDYRPWDTGGEPQGQTRLKPFSSGNELRDTAISIFNQLHPEFSKNLKLMESNNLFDLDSRKGKAPGGYNYPLEVTGMPFIFMNAAGTQRDVVTMMHEGGHAMHTFFTNDEPLVFYRDTPAEMAETASMSMELMTSPHWDKFYNEADHLRARKEHLEGIITFFPWCAIVDAFQHWIYLNPTHSVEERNDYFIALSRRFSPSLVNWEGYEHFRRNSWQRQGHIFSSPFYYIEYGIAQLGALQVYRNFIQNPKIGLDGYIRGLRLGSTKSLPKVWEAMGIKFDFSADSICSLMEFVQGELDKLNQ
ncbi:MAG: M3 family oligoendopeptidase [Candidatus Marinimicrobia bacterium]|nr:M3 family oligoendopeptidase [Candidatus Neomarinimicrobiota bacterium]